MNARAGTPERIPGRRLQVAPASALLALYAAVLLLAALLFPWWRMENRAPQYGMRVLWVNVSPFGVEGDVKEIDGLGHYVGMAPIASLASVERAIAPYAVAFVVLCALALPFVRGRRWRAAAAAAVVAVPLGFAADLWFWQRWSVTHLDPSASLNLIADRVQAQLVGSYTVAQFKVDARFQTGFWLVVVAACNALGLLLVERRPRRLATAPAGKPVAGAAVEGSSRRGVTAVTAVTAVALLLAGPARDARPQTPDACQARPAAAPATSRPALSRPTVARSHGETQHVGPGQAHRTIAAGVGAAGPGDTVVVHAGSYRENVVVGKSLTLMTEEGAVVDGAGAGTVILLRQGPAAVRGFMVRGSGTSLLEEDAGIKVLDAEDCVVEDNRVVDSLFGILVRSGARATLRGNHVVGKELPLPRQGDGIRLQDASGSLIEHNTIEKSRDLAIWQANDCVVRHNTVRGCRYGVHYMYCDDHVFEDNVFTGNQTGGAVMYSRRLVLRRNRFEGSRGPSAYGLLVKDADEVLAERNWFVDNTSGLFLEDIGSSRLECGFRDNVIAGNDVGVSLQPSVSRVLFTGNAFVANRLQVQVLGRTRGDQNRWSDAGRGNYWSDYIGFDADGDGTGDSPYALEAFFEEMADRHPGVGLLRLGPAIQALEMAARAFPVVRPRPVVQDDHPLVAPPTALCQADAARRSPMLGAIGLLGLLVAGGAVARARAVLGGGPS